MEAFDAFQDGRQSLALRRQIIVYILIDRATNQHCVLLAVSFGFEVEVESHCVAFLGGTSYSTLE
jgi:hypothetical protein